MKHLELTEKPETPNYEGQLGYYKNLATQNAVLADRYRLQSLIYLGEVQRANKALAKRARQVTYLKDSLSRHPTK